MLRAREIMKTEPPYCSLDASLKDIAKRFTEESISGMLVIDGDKRLLGVITESDLIDQQAQLHLPTAMAVFDMVIPLGEERFEKELARMQAICAEDLMTMLPKTVNADADLAEISTLMSDDDVHHLPVLEAGSVVGLISRSEVIKALAVNINA
ncbi:MAG: CBS domain-containing protein [Mariprofundaceae bacterium]